MATLTVDIKQLRRWKGPAKPEAEPTPVCRPLRPTPLMATLERMTDKNPVLGKLIKDLDLEPQSVTLPPGHERLWTLAGEALPGGYAFTQDEATDLIRMRLNIPSDRAGLGFTMMVEAHAIEQTVDPNLFYLGGSTPF